jgi:uncharacterized protein (DUF924 family)
VSLPLPEEAADILEFWWSAGFAKWFEKNDAFDAEIARRFSVIYKKAQEGRCDHWAETPLGLVALILCLDQFPRNIYRDSKDAFSSDKKARSWTYFGIEKGFDRVLPNDGKLFLYMPLMHSETLEDQMLSVKLYRKLGMQEPFHYALIHMEAIARFGRFPHRNTILGRDSSEEELEYLKDGGFEG